MTLKISSVFTYDEDAGNYIQAVEAADGQVLEGATRKAINNFVLGCKADGIWSAIKASCILAGARTLSGALVPLVGTAPTNFNFVSGDYNRKTGLVGDGSTKYLDSNRNNNADPQNNKHVAIYGTSSTSGAALAAGRGSTGATALFLNTSEIISRNNSATQLTIGTAPTASFLGNSRATSTGYSLRYNRATVPVSQESQMPAANSYYLFANGLPLANYSTNRLAFYSIGESLDLALLDARVTDLINAFGAAIP